MMHMLGQALVGLVIGVVAKLLMPGGDPGGWIITALLGIAGGWAGGAIGRALGWYKRVSPQDLPSRSWVRCFCFSSIDLSSPRRATAF